MFTSTYKKGPSAAITLLGPSFFVLAKVQAAMQLRQQCGSTTWLLGPKKILPEVVGNDPGNQCQVPAVLVANTASTTGKPVPRNHVGQLPAVGGHLIDPRTHPRIVN